MLNCIMIILNIIPFAFIKLWLAMKANAMVVRSTDIKPTVFSFCVILPPHLFMEFNLNLNP